MRKHVASENEHLMVADHKGRILHITTKLAALLGAPSSRELLRTDFSRFMAQPFSQLHSKWMKVGGGEAGARKRMHACCACRRASPTAHRTVACGSLLMYARAHAAASMPPSTP